MSAKTAQAHRYGADPVTPVVIKTGGDEDPTLSNGDPTLSPVTITSDTIPFAEIVPGPTWESSKSTSNGRITKLTVQDGTTNAHHEVNPGTEPASVTIKFGASEVIAMESSGAEGEVVMLITSPEIPFRVPEEGHWTSATSMFPPITSVTLMVGDHKEFAYHCQNPDDVTVKIYFE